MLFTHQNYNRCKYLLTRSRTNAKQNHNKPICAAHFSCVPKIKLRANRNAMAPMPIIIHKYHSSLCAGCACISTCFTLLIMHGARHFFIPFCIGLSTYFLFFTFFRICQSFKDEPKNNTNSQILYTINFMQSNSLNIV